MVFNIRDIDKANALELETVTRMCMTTVLETIPEFEGSEERARQKLSNLTFEQMSAMIRADFDRPTHRFLVAVADDGRIVGHSMVSKKVAPGGESYGSFFSRYVEPEFRRHGVASQLMAEALAWLDQYDCALLLAQTHVTNEPLRRLFERHGFRVIERSEHPWPHFTLRRDRQPMPK